MDNGLISKIECLVKNACYQKENIFGCNIWEYHILPVVKYSKVLADRFCIDKECAILSAYLHDYASVLIKNIMRNIIGMEQNLQKRYCIEKTIRNKKLI